jgi:hypothetical protein
MPDGDLFQSIVFIHSPYEEIHDLGACFFPVHGLIVYYLNYKVKRISVPSLVRQLAGSGHTTVIVQKNMHTPKND